MAQGQKTGGRQKGTPNSPKPLKLKIQAISKRYLEPRIRIDDPALAELLGEEVGARVSLCEIDMAHMDPKDRAAMQEKLLRYHTPQMQSVSAEISLQAEVTTTIEDRLASLAGQSSK